MEDLMMSELRILGRICTKKRDAAERELEEVNTST
jgi:hypothetical protein